MLERIERTEEYVDFVTKEINEKIDEKIDQVESLKQRIEQVALKVDKINSNTTLYYPDEYPRVKFTKTQLKSFDRGLGEMYNFVDLINSDLNELKAPFIAEQILPTVKYPINDTHLAKILSQPDRNGF